MGFEPTTSSLRKRCSTVELSRRDMLDANRLRTLTRSRKSVNLPMPPPRIDGSLDSNAGIWEFIPGGIHLHGEYQLSHLFPDPRS